MKEKQAALLPRYQKVIDQSVAWAQAIRRRIHQNPEIGFEEKATAALVAKELRSMGAEVRIGVAETGVVGLIRGGRPGKTIAFRADMDALPMQEKTGLPYASRNKGVMHACGHDGHTAVLLGAARVLSAAKKDLSGNVKLIFQPAEEGDGGGKLMVRAGVLGKPAVDRIYALHGWPSLACGQIGFVRGACFAAADRLHITILGKGGHAAMPDQAVDSIYLAAAVLQNLQSVVSRRISALDAAVLSLCTIHGGSAFNIIPPSVEMTGTLRTFERGVRSRALREIRRICAHTAAMHGGRAECRFNESYTPTVNNDKALDFAKGVVERELGRKHVSWIKPTTGSEDFCCFLGRVPGAYLMLGTAPAGKKAISVHNPGFDFNDNAIPAGIRLFSGLALNYLVEG